MKNKDITLYEIRTGWIHPIIVKKSYKLDNDDKIEIRKDGYIELTRVDAVESGHNGDWSDEHIYGYKTFNKAKAALVKLFTDNFKDEIKHIKSLKETE